MPESDARSAPRAFDAVERMIIGATEMVLDLAAPAPAGQVLPASSQVSAAGSEQPAVADAGQDARSEPGVARAASGLPAGPVAAERDPGASGRRARSRWTIILRACGVLVVVFVVFVVGVWWLGAGPEPQDAPPARFDNPISARPAVPMVAEPRADQLGLGRPAPVPGAVLQAASAAAAIAIPGGAASGQSAASAGAVASRVKASSGRSGPAVPAARGASAAMNAIVALSEDRRAPLSGGTASSSPSAATVRTAVYGRSGILALTPSAVVVFDEQRRVQAEVKLGALLPDGSRVVAIHPDRHQVDTDRGALVLSSPPPGAP